MTPTDKEKTYRIGEAAELLGLETYVLRFWETEFPHIAPLRTPKGQRVYAERHIDRLKKVKFLLHEQGFTIEGARRALEAESDGDDVTGSAAPCQGFLFAPSGAGATPQPCPSEDRAGEAALPGAPRSETDEEAVQAALDGPHLREAVQALYRELVDVRELLRAGRQAEQAEPQAGSSGDVS